MSDWETSEGEHWAANADRYTRMLAGYGDILAGAASFASGERVLDVGCGCGDMSIAAARAFGPAGSVLGVDPSSAELAVAARRAADAGLQQVAASDARKSTFGAAWLVTASA